jgi:hypothetical protein
LVLPKGIENANGPSTEQQINESFTDVINSQADLIILGNSGIYRGVNPDGLNIKSYNFAHDNDSYNQIYYKILWMNSKKLKFKYMLLGVDYFQFSFLSGTRNYVYNSYFDEDYERDFKEVSEMDNYLNKSQIFDFNRLKYIRNVLSKKTTSIFHRKNGQYIKPGTAKIDDEYYYSIERLELQEKYFNLIINYCDKNDIEIFLCMLPVRKNSLKNYEKERIVEFNQYINSFTNDKIHYINYSYQKGWGVEDYTDITHLNEKAADRFTKQLNDSIMQILIE